MDYVPRIYIQSENRMKEIADLAAGSLDKYMQAVSVQERESIAWLFFEHVLTLNDFFNNNDIIYHNQLLDVFHKYDFLKFKKTTDTSSKCINIPKRHHVIFADMNGDPRFQMSFRTYRELKENSCDSFSRVYRMFRKKKDKFVC